MLHNSFFEDPVSELKTSAQTDLAGLNKRLRAAGVAPIRANLPPPRDLNAADRD